MERDSQIGAAASSLKDFVRACVSGERSRARRSLQRFSLALLVLATLFTATWALATSYIYDANGRLVVVTNDAGQSARYVYDAMGNIERVERLEADDLAIFGFNPGRGATGVAVKVQGHGFSATPGQNTVKFNGVTAAVSAATATELTTAVPVTATTGPITVTIGAETASSPIDFVVDEDAQPPVITSVSPLVAAIGDPIIVGGTHFNPVANQTTVRLNQRPVTPSTLSDTQVIFPVPSGTGSGKVSISTPFGTATSSQDVLVLPNGTASGDIEQSQRLTIDAPAQTFSVTTTGKYVAALFDAASGDYLSAQFAAISVANVSYWLYGTNNRLLSNGTVSPTSPTIHLPKLTAAGTYLLLMKPVSGPAAWQLAIERDKKVMSNGADTSIATTVTMQSKRLSFAATAGQNLGFGISGLTTVGGNGYVNVAIYRPDGSSLTSNTCYASNGGCGLNIGSTVTGTYTAVVTPSGGTMQFQTTLSSDIVGTLLPDTAQTLTLGRRGQNARLTFTGTAGQTVALQIAGQTTTPANRTVYYHVYKPNGTLLTSISTTLGTTLNLPELPANGTFLVYVDPYYGETATAHLILSTGTTSDTELDGGSGTFETTVPGQNAYLTFIATAGQNLGLGISNLTVTGANGYATVSVYHPDGSSLTSNTCYVSNGGCGLNIGNTVAGTYSVVVAPAGSETMQFQTTLSSDIVGTLLPDTMQTLTLGRRGQNARLSFAGTAGQTVALQIAGQTTTPANRTVYYHVYKPNGTLLTSISTTLGTTLNLPELPANGTFLVYVDPYYGEIASAQMTLSTGTTGGMEQDGANGTYSTTLPGENVYLTFTATAGQNLGLGISDLVVNTSGYVSVNVYRPDGSSLTGVTCYASNGGCGANISNTVAGIYSVVVQPSASNQTMNFNATLSTDLTGALSPDVAQSVTLGRRGQNARLTFTGTAGQTVALQVAGQTTTPANRTVYYHVYKPNGNLLASASATLGTTLNLPELPANGTFLVYVDPYYGETATAQVTLSTGTTGGMQLDGNNGTFATTVPGQDAYLTFAATAGQNLGLGISDLTMVGGNGYVSVSIYRPDGSSLTSNTCYASNGGCGLNIGNAVAGTYSVVVTPSGGTMQFQTTLSSDATGTLPPDTAQTLTLGRRGQNARLSFAGTAGQTVALQILAQTTVPANRTVYYSVYKPNGALLTSGGATTGTTLNLPELPANGTFLVYVDPYYGEIATAQVTLSTGTTSGMQLDGSSGMFAATIPGQSAYLTFAAVAGQNLGLGISNLTVTGGSGYASVSIYRPDGSSLTNSTCYASNDGCGLGIGNTVAGTYSVVVAAPSGSETMQFQTTLSSDIADTLPPDATQTLTLGRRGQNARLTFTGTAGENVALRVVGQTTVPANRQVLYSVYKPNGTSLTSAYVAGSGVLNLQDLPANGTFLVYVDPNYGETATAEITLDSTP